MTVSLIEDLPEIESVFISDFRVLYWRNQNDYRNRLNEWADPCTPVVFTYSFLGEDTGPPISEAQKQQLRAGFDVFEAEFGLNFVEVDMPRRALHTYRSEDQDFVWTQDTSYSPYNSERRNIITFEEGDYSLASDDFDELLKFIMMRTGHFYDPGYQGGALFLQDAYENKDYTVFSRVAGSVEHPKELGILDKQALHYAFGSADAMKGWQVFQTGDTSMGIRGSKRDDAMLGTNVETEIWGRAGHDKIWGRGTADTLYGGAGRDILIGHGGDDVLKGGNSADELYGDLGPPIRSQTIFDDTSKDRLYGQMGNDALYGGWDDDILVGGRGQDMLDGGVGDDVLKGGTGRDALLGGDGNDFLDAGGGDDTLNGGAGDDRMIGGRDKDVFIFDETAFGGHDRILDFELGTDELDLGTLTEGEHSLTFTHTASALRMDYVNENGGFKVDIEGFGLSDFLELALTNYVGLFDAG